MIAWLAGLGLAGWVENGGTVLQVAGLLIPAVQTSRTDERTTQRGGVLNAARSSRPARAVVHGARVIRRALRMFAQGDVREDRRRVGTARTTGWRLEGTSEGRRPPDDRLEALEERLRALKEQRVQDRQAVRASHEDLEEASEELRRDHEKDIRDLAVGSLPIQSWGLLVTALGAVLASVGDQIGLLSHAAQRVNAKCPARGVIVSNFCRPSPPFT